ncbi:hypothetical protein CSA37_08250 [Candidatus Fermentibacteria bacterium]|nr:MAG: hypothetical protein CSA37_08250 [Candidatus Fermentibacteria bacterium]
MRHSSDEATLPLLPFQAYSAGSQDFSDAQWDGTYIPVDLTEFFIPGIADGKTDGNPPYTELDSGPDLHQFRAN